jgi:hypothetical protein
MRNETMGAAYFIVLEREIEGVDISMDGKSLSQYIESLDDAARQLGVRPLSEFYSADTDQLAHFLESDAAEIGDVSMAPLQNFAAEEGLITIRALRSHSVAQMNGLTQDLSDCERILSAAAQQRVGWHFEVDF